MAQFFRTTLFPSLPERAWTTIWSRGDPADNNSVGLIRRGETWPTITLVHSSGSSVVPSPIALRASEEFEAWHWQTFLLPPNTPSGEYRVLVNGRTEGLLLCAPPPAVRSGLRLHSNASAATVNQYLPTHDINLAPADLTGNITMTLNSTFRANGSHLFGNLVLAPGCTVQGLTVHGNVFGDFSNATLDRCTFSQGLIGPILPRQFGCLFRDCRFENASVSDCGSGMFLRCRFVGPPILNKKQWHSFCNDRGERLAVIDCCFDRTDRGLILRAKQGDNSNNLYAGIWFQDIALTPNGCELFCHEGTPGAASGFNRNLIFAVRQLGCVGSVLMYDATCCENLYQNVRIPFDITGMGNHRANTIQDCECEYIHINWPTGKGDYFAGAIKTRLIDVGCVNYRPSAQNQASGDPKFYKPGRFRAVVEDGSPAPSTEAWRLSVVDEAPGFLKTFGVVVHG